MLGALIGLIMAGTPLPFAELVADPVEEQKVAWMTELHKCENINNVPKILDTNGYYSYADFMYQMATWLKYGKRFGANKTNISSSTLQWKVTRYVLDTYGWENDWVTCGKLTVKKLGLYPSS